MKKIVAYQNNNVDLFGNKGQFCNVCKKLDFLPFECNYCNNWFCKECFNEHKVSKCFNSNNTDKKIPQCPICNEFILLENGKSLDYCVDLHIRSGCKKGILKHNKKINKCSYKKCKEEIEIFSYECKYCFKKYCLKHRFHNCKNEN